MNPAEIKWLEDEVVLLNRQLANREQHRCKQKAEIMDLRKQVQEFEAQAVGRALMGTEVIE